MSLWNFVFHLKPLWGRIKLCGVMALPTARWQNNKISPKAARLHQFLCSRHGQRSQYIYRFNLLDFRALNENVDYLREN